MIPQKRDKFAFLLDQRFILFLMFILLNVLFSLLSSNFLQIGNYYNMLRQSAMIMITASGATLLMMTGNFDLSTGSNVAFTGVLYALLATSGVPLLWAAVSAILCGACFGVVNGTLVAKFNVPPFIATLGMMYIGRGLALVACNGQSIRKNIPENFSQLSHGDFIGIPIPVVLTIVFVLFFWILEKRSLLGKYAMSIGGNKNAAFHSGINVGGITFWLFVIVGALAAFSGVMTASRIGAGDPRTGSIFFLDVIVAILLGGTSLEGGKGSVVGMLMGALIVVVLGNGLNMLNVLVFWQGVLKGVILVLAVILNEKILKDVKRRSIIPQAA